MSPLEASTASSRSRIALSATRSVTVNPRWSSRPRSNIPAATALGGRLVIGHLEDMQHGISGHQDCLPGMTGSATEDNGGPQTDGVLVEGPKAIEIAGHNGNVADSAGRAHLRRRSART